MSHLQPTPLLQKLSCSMITVGQLILYAPSLYRSHLESRGNRPLKDLYEDVKSEWRREIVGSAVISPNPTLTYRCRGRRPRRPQVHHAGPVLQ